MIFWSLRELKGSNGSSREEGGKAKETKTIFDTLPRAQVSALPLFRAIFAQGYTCHIRSVERQSYTCHIRVYVPYLLLSEYGMYKSVSARFGPLLSGKSP